MKYAELSCSTAFSFLTGACEPEELVERAAELELEAVAITDRAGLYGVPRFCKAAKEAGIKPIVGVRLGVRDRNGGCCTPGDGSESWVTLLVKNEHGYSSLCNLISDAKLARGRRETSVTFAELEEHCNGLICLAGPGLVPRCKFGHLDILSGIFGRRNLYVELQRHLVRSEEAEIAVLVDMARKLDLPLVVSNGVLYARSEQAKLADAMACIREGVNLDEAGTLLKPNREWRLKSGGEMAHLFAGLPEALRSVCEVADRCTFELGDLGYEFPKFPVDKDENQVLRELVYAGASDRYGTPGPDVKRQIEKELALIAKLGMAGYFLVVWDIVKFCMDRGIMVQGRGSAANSVVCYCLKITAVDPVARDLLFERFLSEARGEWPDIDLDLPSGSKREQVIQYVYGRYGERGAAMTAVVITFRARSAARELAKVIGFTPEQVERLAGSASPWPGSSRGPEWDTREWLGDAGLDPDSKRSKAFLELFEGIMGLPRHMSQHPGGMVISGTRLDRVVPMEPAAMQGRRIIQWDKDDCADLGILKIDLLGLGMMQVLERTIALVHEHEGVKIDLAKLPQRDQEVFDALKKADTVGVFQVESRAQMAVLPRMKPERFYDLVVEVALIRPGPIVGRMVNPYLERRAGRKPVTYPHPSLEPVLRRTLGVPLFQEQLMRIAMEAAGFTPEQAEELRRAMGFKRSNRRLAALEDRLRQGLEQRNFAPGAVDTVLQSLRSFSEYGFPESHAASFALITYASAYLKVHHPACYLAAMLDSYPLGFYSPAVLVKDAQRHGVVVLPVDVNASGLACRVVNCESSTGGKAVRLGLKFVWGLRRSSCAAIEREQAVRRFAGPSDLANRCGLNRSELQRLAEIGAFGSLGLERRQALWQVSKLKTSDIPLLPRLDEPELERVTCPLRPMSDVEKCVTDLRLSGITVGTHPIAFLREKLFEMGVSTASDLAGRCNGEDVSTAGMVVARQRPRTAKGVVFVTLEDETGFANLVVKPDVFVSWRRVITGSRALLASGKLEKRDGVIQVLATEFEDLEGLGIDTSSRSRSRDFR